MYLTDFHNHSICSPDGNSPMREMALAGVRAGLSEMCITDHFDLLGFDGAPVLNQDWAPLRAQYESALGTLPAGFTFRFGIELGGANANPDHARGLLSLPELDFAIGSVHNCSPAQGGIDFYFLNFSTPAFCYTALDDYFNTMSALAAMPDCYDVLGHIIYPLRYMNDRDGQNVSIARYMPQIEDMLRTAVQAGRGIEINTCRGRTIEEWRPVLERYKAVGGEIITLGSDAHRPDDVGKGIAEGMDLLRETGFGYVTTYEKRKPIFHKIEQGRGRL